MQSANAPCRAQTHHAERERTMQSVSTSASGLWLRALGAELTVIMWHASARSEGVVTTGRGRVAAQESGSQCIRPRWPSFKKQASVDSFCQWTIPARCLDSCHQGLQMAGFWAPVEVAFCLPTLTNRAAYIFRIRWTSSRPLDSGFLDTPLVSSGPSFPLLSLLFLRSRILTIAKIPRSPSAPSPT